MVNADVYSIPKPSWYSIVLDGGEQRAPDKGVMLERASTCLETGGRRLLRAPKACIRSRRSLHSTFWRHGAMDLKLPIWWSSVAACDRTAVNGTDDDVGGKSSEASKAFEGQLLDFLYPAKTLALIRRLSQFSPKGIDVCRRPRLHGNGVRQFSTTRSRRAERTDLEHGSAKVALDEKALDEEVEETLRDFPAAEALQNLLASREEGKQRLAGRFYLAVPESERSPQIQADLLEYLASDRTLMNPNEVVDIFNALPPSDRRSSSYRAAISAYLSLETVGLAVQLHEAAAEGHFGIDIGTDLILAHVVQDNQWDLGLRVLKTFMSVASREGFDVSQLYRDPSRQRYDPAIIWGSVASVPYLRGHVDSFLLHLREFHHDLTADENNLAVIDQFILGLSAEAGEQMLNMEPPQEATITQFFTKLFQELRDLKFFSSVLYDYFIRRMLQIPRYRAYSNEGKLYLRLYRQYRREWITEAEQRKWARPSRSLMR